MGCGASSVSVRIAQQAIDAKEELLTLYREGRVLPASAPSTPVFQVPTKTSPEKVVGKETEALPPANPQAVVEGRKKIFISYNWGIQSNVKKLKEMLEHELNVPCWMDLSVMGGGQTLFGEIAKGVRNADVVVSCITNDYIKSDNCKKEISLSADFKKPIIPLMVDFVGWPVPEDAMAFAYAGKLFIEFNEESSFEETSQPMQQLVTQLQKFVKPDTPRNSGADRGANRGAESGDAKKKADSDYGDAIQHKEVRDFWNKQFADRDAVPQEEFRKKFEEFLCTAFPNSRKKSQSDVDTLMDAFNPSKLPVIQVDNVGALFPPAQAVAYSIDKILLNETHGVVPDRNYVSVSIGREKDIEELHNLLSSPGIVFVGGESGLGKTHLATKISYSMLESGTLQEAFFIQCRGLKDRGGLVHRTVETVCPPGASTTERELKAWMAKRKGRYMIVFDDAESAMKEAVNQEHDQGAEDFFRNFLDSVLNFDTNKLATILITTTFVAPWANSKGNILMLKGLAAGEVKQLGEKHLSNNNKGVSVISKLSCGVPLVTRMLSAVVSLGFKDEKSLEAEHKSSSKSEKGTPSAVFWCLKVCGWLPQLLQDCLLVSALFPGNVDPAIVAKLVGTSDVHAEMVQLSQLELIEYHRYDSGAFSLRGAFKKAIIDKYFDGGKIAGRKDVQWRKQYMSEVAELIREAASCFITGKDSVGRTALRTHFDDVLLFLDVVSQSTHSVPAPFSSSDTPVTLASFMIWGETSSCLTELFSSSVGDAVCQYIKNISDRIDEKDHPFLKAAFSAMHVYQTGNRAMISLGDTLRECREIVTRLEGMTLSKEQEPFKGILWYYISFLEGKARHDDAAIESGKQAIKIIKAHRDRPEVCCKLARCYTSLGFNYALRKEYKTAIEYYEEAMKVDLLPRRSVPTSRTLNSMGDAKYEQGKIEEQDGGIGMAKYKEARDLVEEALSIRDQYHGLVNAQSTTSLNILAKIHIAMNNFDEAEKLLLRSKSITEQLKADKARLATVLYILGTLEEKRDNRDSALRSYKECLSMRQQVLPPDHPETKEVEQKLEFMNG